MVKRHISKPISRDTVCSVLGKNSLNWTLVQRKEILAKNDLKLGLKFVPKVFRKQTLNFCEEDVGFYFDGASVTQKLNSFDQDSSKSYCLEKGWTRIRFHFNCRIILEKHIRECCSLYGSNCRWKLCNRIRAIPYRINAKMFFPFNILSACLKKSAHQIGTSLTN